MLGEAASLGALPGVNLGRGVGLPVSDALPGAPGAGDILPAGEVPGLPGGVPLGANVGLAGGEVTPRGVAAGETAPVGFAGEAAGVPAPPGEPVGGLAAPRAAAPVGGGTFLGFSVLIFCFSCASLGTPAQPRLIFGCATFAFTVGGFAVGGALASLGGAATTSLFPCTFVNAPDFAATERLPADCRSMLSR
jgi:hypothetical protein